MAHYNLYETLGLDRNDSSANLRSALESRLEGGKFDNPGGEEEVKLAINVLGDEQKRGLYDSRLDDPSADDVDVAALRQLSELNLGGANPSAGAGTSAVGGPAGLGAAGAGAAGVAGAAAGAGQDQQPDQGAAIRDKFDNGLASAKQGFASAREGATKQAHELGAEYKKSSKKAITVTAIAAAVGGLIVGGLLGGLLGGGGGATLKDEGGAKDVAQAYIDADSKRAVEDWVDEYVSRDNREYFADPELPEDEFDARDLKVGETASSMHFESTMMKGERESYKELAEAEKLEDQGRVAILDGNDELVGYISMRLIDGEWEVTYIDTAAEVEFLVN